MDKFKVSLETLRTHSCIDGAVDDGIELFEAGGIEPLQDTPSHHFKCIVPTAGKEHVTFTYTDDCCDLKSFSCDCTRPAEHLLCRHVVASVLAVQRRIIAKPVFRKATRNDTPVILEFIKKLAVYEKMLPDVTATPKLLEYWLFDKQAAEVLFAVVDGREVGFALYFSNFSTFLGKAGLHLEDLFVLPQYRGCGIGKGLLTKLARIAVERGYGRMEWACLDWNKPSIDFYRSIGAVDMSDWTTYRLTGDTLDKLHSNSV